MCRKAIISSALRSFEFFNTIGQKRSSILVRERPNFPVACMSRSDSVTHLGIPVRPGGKADLSTVVHPTSVCS
jgi:hypothetical protein